MDFIRDSLSAITSAKLPPEKFDEDFEQCGNYTGLLGRIVSRRHILKQGAFDKGAYYRELIGEW